ncbi:MAG: alpha/beta hydrolase [Clostridiales bacterium]|nr:alpha/beta hydrolase [Clostridiales bacterium]
MKMVYLQENNFEHQMKHMVKPYLEQRETVLWPEREPGRKIHCLRYLADRPKGIILISHGYTEFAGKYREAVYYFLRAGYHVYLPEHCGHGYSYRLTEDPSLVHVDSFRRYVDDLLFVADMAREEFPDLKMYLYAHSMGGGIGAAAAAEKPQLFEKVVLTSPMIRPLTGSVPWPAAAVIAAAKCKAGKSSEYLAGQLPYEPGETFEGSSALSRARFEEYLREKESDVHHHLSACSYGWLHATDELNRFLQMRGWRQITAPLLMFEAGQERYVSNPEQRRFVKKISRRGCSPVRMVYVAAAKHEIFNAGDAVTERYWRRVFSFLR